MSRPVFQLDWHDVLNTAENADQSAEVLLDKLDQSSDVVIDLSRVERMTPSFANTLVMRLLARYDRPTLRSRCVFVNPKPHVAAALRRAVERYEFGIRLSDQSQVA